MEHPKILRFIIFTIILLVGEYSFAIDYSPPQDLPTLEALIAFHKDMKKYEMLSLTQVTETDVIQDQTKDISGKIHDVKSTIHNKMKDVNSYLILASTLTNTILKLEQLTKELVQYETEIGPMVVRKPYAINNFIDTQKKLYHTVMKLTEKITVYSLEGLNMLVASMDEKFKFISMIDASINEMRYLLFSSYNYIKYVIRGDVNRLMPGDVVPAEKRSALVEEIVEKWQNTKI